MSLFSAATEAQLSRALAEGVAVFLVGPRRCGLTRWATSAFANAVWYAAGSQTIDVATAKTVAELQTMLADRFGLSDAPENPRDLQILLGRDLPRDGTYLLTIFANLHNAAPEVLDWILNAVLDQVIGGSEHGPRFVFEGALDTEQSFLRAFNGSWPANTLVEYVAHQTPWRTLILTEEVCESLSKRHHEALVPWLADVTGGDTGLAVELLRLIPEEEVLDEQALEAACDRVVRASRWAYEVREAARRPSAQPVLKKLVQGDAILGQPPSTLESSPVKALYLDGIAAYDPILRGYRIRSRLANRIVSEVIEEVDRSTRFEGLHARTSYLIWQIGVVELSMRARMGDLDIAKLAREVKTNTVWQGLARAIKRSLVEREPSLAKIIPLIDRVLKEMIPDKQPILTAATSRHGCEPSADELPNALTFSELNSLLTKGGIVDSDGHDALCRLGSLRNDVAHFRPVQYGELLEAGRDVRSVLRCIWQRQTIPSA